MQELHYGALMRLCLSDNALGAQGAADLAHRLVDIGLGQRAAPRQLVEDAAKAFRERIEHQDFRSRFVIVIAARQAMPAPAPKTGRRAAKPMWRRSDKFPKPVAPVGASR